MKNYSFIIVFFLAFPSFAQDIITKKNGEEIKALVKEITPNEIKYKRFDNPDGPLIYLAKSDIFLITYQNGITEKFGKETPQVEKAIPEADKPHPAQPQEYPHTIRPVNLSGPRLGFTYISPGRTANRLKDEFNAVPFLSLFGWQFETQFFTLPSGTTGVVEFIPLIGGLEQGLFLPTASLLIGMRGPSGIELGMGPNLSLSGAAMVFAAGINLRNSEINFPVNFAVVASPGGVRYSIVLGFNMRKN
ncbi:MAG: hypothetical protein H0V01_11285 [Bacteroidetes bacterium]|nr:hypothetical protein [Bacteroidota bacterium]HET6243349.1 hypothetical protein [Bacteroidia bacterium]